MGIRLNKAELLSAASMVDAATDEVTANLKKTESAARAKSGALGLDSVLDGYADALSGARKQFDRLAADVVKELRVATDTLTDTDAKLADRFRGS